MHNAISFEKVDDGIEHYLNIVIDDQEDMPEIRLLLDTKGPIDAWYELIEHKLCNGWTSLQDQLACYSNPFTISDDVTQDDNGKFTFIGRVYYYPYWETKCPIEDLLENGYITLHSTKE